MEPAGAPHLARRMPSADELLAAVEPVLCEALVGQVGASFQVDIALPGGARSSYFIDLSSGHCSSGSCGAFGRVSGASPRGFVLLGSAKWPLVWVKHAGFPSEREHRWKTGSQVSSWLAEWDGSGAGGSCLPPAPRGTRGEHHSHAGIPSSIPHGHHRWFFWWPRPKRDRAGRLTAGTGHQWSSAGEICLQQGLLPPNPPCQPLVCHVAQTQSL